MKLVVGTWDAAWGHTWVSRGFGRLYALRSLAGGSSLCIADDGTPSGDSPVICRPGAPGWMSYPTPGEHSCHITLLDRQAVVADYTSGTLSLYPLGADGLPIVEPEVLRFQGSGPHPTRQQGPHIHSSWPSPDGKSLVVADLGADRLYRFVIVDGHVSHEGIEVFNMPAGCGPRHCAFGKGKLYVSTELTDEVLVLDWPSMALRQRVLVNDARPGGGGHLVLSPDGRFLYASARLENDGIAVFRVLEDGLLERVSYCRTGLHPRHFCLAPDASAIIVACRDSNEVQIFLRDPADGSLSYTGQSYSIEKPVFVQAYEED